MFNKLFSYTFALVIIAIPVFSSLLVHAQTNNTQANTSSWLHNEPAELTLSQVLDSNKAYFDYNPNYGCRQTTFTTRPARVGLGRINKDVCATNTLFGSYGNEYLQLEGTGTAGQLTEHIYSTQSPFIAIPRSRHIFRYYNSGGQTGLQLIKNVREHLTSTVSNIGEVKYVLQQTAKRQDIVDYSGKKLYFRLETRSFSNNGKWLVLDSNRGAVRIHTETGEVLPFQYTQKYEGGLNPFMQTAVSSNGRYVVASSQKNDYWRVYDLQTCSGEDWDSITANCQKRSYYDVFSNLTDGTWHSHYHRFLDSNNIQTLVGTRHNTHVTLGWYTLTAPHEPVFGTDTPTFKYLALGDSFASGEGAYSYRAETDSGGNYCHQSLASYPYLLIHRLSYETSDSVACSGAVTKDILDTSKQYNKESQSPHKSDDSNDDEIYTNFLPGYRAQLNFVENEKPEIITISVGGNDVGFADKIKYCIGSGTCYPTYEDRLELLYEIDRLSNNLVDAYLQIKEGAHPNSRIYVLGYPSIVKPGGNCGVNVRLNSDETLFAHQLSQYLNTAIKRATQQAGVFYVDVEQALNDHRLCEAVYSNTAVNGLTAGNDPFSIGPISLHGPIGKESFHPNALGHKLYSTVVAEKTNNLSAPMPTPISLAEHAPNKENLEILNRPKTGRQLNSVNFDNDPENNVIYKNNGISEQFVYAVLHIFNPGTTVQLALHSEPTQLGSFTVNDGGEADFELAIPANFPPGYHMLHMYGTNLAGEPVTMQRLVYVAETENDIDGDGVPNKEEICLYGDAANQDYDQDGIDDACDGTISEPTSAVLINTPIINTYNFGSDQSDSNTTNSTTESTNPQSNPLNSEVTSINQGGINSVLNNQTVAAQNKKPSQNNNQTKNEQKSDSVLGTSEFIANSNKTVQNIQKSEFSWFLPLASLGGILVTVFAYFSWLKPKKGL